MTDLRDSAGNLIEVGSTIIFEPKGCYIFGKDGIVEPGEVGEVVQVNRTSSSPNDYRCRISFPRIDKLRVKAGFPGLFLAHSTELRVKESELCDRYNFLICRITEE